MKSISPYYHRHPKIIQGKGAIHTLKDVLIDLSLTTPLYIFDTHHQMEKRMRDIHSSISLSPFIPYKEDSEIDFSSIDSIVVYGGSREINLSDTLSSPTKWDKPIIHIPFYPIRGDEYTHTKRSTDAIIYDWDLCSTLKLPQIGSVMSLMLYYLFASSYENPSYFTQPNLSFVLTTAHSIIEAEREEKSFIVTTLLHTIGDIAFNAEHSSLTSLMEHLEIKSLSTIAESGATLLLPLVRFIKKTNLPLYHTIEENVGNMGVEEFCTYWISLSPLKEKEMILLHIIENMYHLLKTEDDSSTLHTFLTSLKERT